MDIVLREVFLSQQGKDEYRLKIDGDSWIRVVDINGNGKVDIESTTGSPDIILDRNGKEIRLTDEEMKEVIRIVDEYDVVSAARAYAHKLRQKTFEICEDSICENGSEYHVCRPTENVWYPEIDSRVYHSTAYRVSGETMFQVRDFDEDQKADDIQFEEDGVGVVASNRRETRYTTAPDINCLISYGSSTSPKAAQVLSAFDFVFAQD